MNRVTVHVGLAGFLGLFVALLPAADPGPNPDANSQAEARANRGPQTDPRPKTTAATDPKPKPKRKTLRGTVAAVLDGDILTLLVGKQKHGIRLAGIDAPEMGQTFADEATEALAAMLTDKEASVLVLGEDEDGQMLGVLYAERRCVNTVMVGEGWAWYDVRQVQSKTLLEAQEQARKERKGLWAEADPTPPWEWLESHRTTAAEETTFTLREAPAELRPPPSVFPPSAPTSPPQARATSATGYWLNTSTNVRHNRKCHYYGKTKHGRPCGPNEGKACGICGG